MLRIHVGFLSFPEYKADRQLIRSSKIGEFAAPLSAIKDLGDVFDGRSLCVIDQHSINIDGRCAEPQSVAYLANKGVHPTPDGWLCGHFNRYKAVALPENKANPSHLMS